MTWAEFIDEVILRITDTEPTDASFTEAQAEYVRARMAFELDSDKDAYTVHQNRYTSLRRRVVGHSTSQNATAQQTAVRPLVADISANDTQFALACSYWVKAHLVNEVNRKPEEAGSWMGLYRQLRRRLLGYTPTFANFAALKAAVVPFLPVDAASANMNTFLEAQIGAADSDLRGLLAWFVAQVAAADNDLQSLAPRVEKEIRAAAIVLQEYVPAYRLGHTTTVTAGDVVAEGSASSGTLPDGALLREVWTIYREDGEEATPCGRKIAERVGWDDRYSVLVCRTETDARCIAPAFAIEPHGREYLAVPALVADEIELELIWDGTRLEFDGGDDVPFDEAAAEAAAFRVQSALAAEFGMGVSDAREYERRFNDRMGECFIATNARARSVRG